jgi:hypothetical protein
MEIVNKNSNISALQARKPVVNAALESGTDHKEQEAQLSQIESRNKAQEAIQQNRLNRRRLIEQQAEEQAEKRLHGRLVTDARLENVQRLDDIAHARAVQNKVEQTYTDNRQNRAREQQQQEAIQHQQDIQSHRNSAIDLVV